MTKTCTHPGCNRPYLAKGLCSLHWSRNKRGADMDAPSQRGKRTGAAAKPPRAKRAPSPPPHASDGTELEQFRVVAAALGFPAEELLEQAQRDFARSWLADLKAKARALGAPMPAAAPRQSTRSSSRPRVVRTSARFETDTRDAGPTDDDEPEVPKKDPRECSGCGGIINCLISCPVGTHRNARQKAAAAG